MQSRTGDKIRLQHIFDAIFEIENYLLGSDFSDFLGNSMMRFACVKQLEIIGEAGNHISNETKKKFSEIEWGKLWG
jgi:uncharacterized protein with HEPN domain